MLSTLLAAGSENAAGGAAYLASARRLADVVLEHGRDRYGPRHTRLFADGLHVKTFEPARWKWRGQNWVLCNFASQQALLRTLDGLTTLTGEVRYRQAALDATADAFEYLRAPSGLLYWGGHMAWDLETDKPAGQYDDVHEVKNHQPDFALMWQVDRAAASTLMRAIWFAHVVDWSLLDYNRHASLRTIPKPGWNTPFKSDLEVPFPSTANNLSFALVTPTLLHSGVMLFLLEKNTNALTWSRNLALRWQQARDAKTGLSGGQLSYRPKDRAQEALGHVYPNINEARIIATYHQTTRYHTLTLAQMQAGARLLNAGERAAEIGREFIRWASEDLKSYSGHSYDPAHRNFRALMTDGTPLDGSKAKPGYYDSSSFAPRAPDGYIFWSYAMAYRLTRDAAHWDMARKLADSLAFGDIGDPDGNGRKLASETRQTDWRHIYAFLELHKASRESGFLRLASKVGNNLLKLQTPTGLFCSQGRDFARTGDDLPLALLHLAAALDGKSDKLAPPVLDNRFFHAEHEGGSTSRMASLGDLRVYDSDVLYGR